MTREFELCRDAAAAILAFSAPLSWAQASHRMMGEPDKLNWAAVPSLPKGAQLAVPEGPMSEAVPFTVRLKFPANYRPPPRWHPAVERVTALSGTFNMGTGGIAIMPAQCRHFAWTASQTVVQLHGTGP